MHGLDCHMPLVVIFNLSIGIPTKNPFGPKKKENNQ
jgi:hypothetical protein